MRANRDPGLAREPHRPAHDVRVAGVEAAGDVAEEMLPITSASWPERPAAERLAQVAVQVDRRRHS